MARAEKELDYLAHTDSVTGLPNRRATYAYLEHELSRPNCRLAMLLIDLDNFKSINDLHGHHGGDMVLKEFVRRTSTVLRSHDLFGRYGGEEFVVLLPDTDHHTALQVAARICHTAQEPGTHAPPTFTASIGVTTGMPAQADLHKFFEEADKALYRAKASGKNRVASHCEISA